MKELPYKDRLKQLGLWTLEERRNRAYLLEMFKILTGKSSPRFESLIERSTLSATRGHSVKLVKHRCKLDLQKYFFCERVIDRWNQLSEDCASRVTVNSFNGKLDKLTWYDKRRWASSRITLDLTGPPGQARSQGEGLGG